MGALIKRGFVVTIFAAAVVVAIGVSTARGEGLSPWWSVSLGSRPTNLVTGADGQIVVTAQNRGDAPTSGEVTLVDELPEGLQATAIKGVAGESSGHMEDGPVSCTLQTLTCTFSGSLRSYEEIEVDISVSVGAGASSGEESIASVSGGSATAGPLTASHAIEVDGRERFGFEGYETIPENAGGSIDTQAGSHPFQITSVVTLNSQTPEPPGETGPGGPRTVAWPKDIVSELPAGLIANPTGLAQCTERQFAGSPSSEAAGINECPAQSAIGVASATVNAPAPLGLDTVTVPIFNMTPLQGEPARFGLKILDYLPAFLDASIRSGGDYGVTLASKNIPEIGWLLSLKLTFWGVPGDPRHDDERGWECLEQTSTCSSSPSTTGATPFLTMPTSCAAPFRSTMRGDSWGYPGVPSEQAEPLVYALPEVVDGCEGLPFAPRVEVAPDGAAASVPTGVSVDVQVPQAAALNPEGEAPSAVKNMTVALPEGLTLNAAGAGGLEACSEPEIGFTGVGELDPLSEQGVETDLFTPSLPEPFCPDASKIGTVKIQTPLLAKPLEGAVYLASQAANPFGSLMAVYVLAQDPVSGVLVKLAGEVSLDPRTGRITVRFQNMPQLPFEAIELDFFGGEDALLASPARCGTYTTDASLRPWSGEPSVSSQSSFQITTGPDGGQCPGVVLPFSPTLEAGTTSINAGSFSPLTATISRGDGQQNIESIQLKLPPGLSAILAGTKLCPEVQANTGTCSQESEIGQTTVSVGVGRDPYTIPGGKVYLTGPYQDAPFGLSIVIPAQAGPFDLQQDRPIVVRAKLQIDPMTAALTITTSTGIGGIPTMIEGIPLQIQHLNLTIDKPSFAFNPTNCNPMTITGTINGGEGASAAVSSPFQIANCANLKLTPKLTALTRSNGEFAGHGASLRVTLAAAAGQANVRALKLDLPQRLPARLQTIQRACPEDVFDTNPAACPKAALIGSASVQTPILATPMAGPAYLVAKDRAGASRSLRPGEAAFPDVVLALRAQGVRIDLTGALYVDEHNITSVTFRSIPDVPIRRLELVLPEGPSSILAASANLCEETLHMSTAITGQNGAHLKPAVKVGVEGCRKPRKAGKRGRRASGTAGRSMSRT